MAILTKQQIVDQIASYIDVPSIVRERASEWVMSTPAFGVDEVEVRNMPQDGVWLKVAGNLVEATLIFAPRPL